MSLNSTALSHAYLAGALQKSLFRTGTFRSLRRTQFEIRCSGTQHSPSDAVIRQNKRPVLQCHRFMLGHLAVNCVLGEGNYKYSSVATRHEVSTSKFTLFYRPRFTKTCFHLLTSFIYTPLVT